MNITSQIADTIYLLRRQPQIDIERLSYELSETEWRQFCKELQASSFDPNARDLSYADSCLFMGMTIRKRLSQGKEVGNEQ